MFIFVIVPNGIQQYPMPVLNFLLWLSGQGNMLGLKCVKVRVQKFYTPQCSHDKRFDNSSASRLLGFGHPSSRHWYSYSFKEKAHRVTKVGEFGLKKGKVRTEKRRTMMLTKDVTVSSATAAGKHKCSGGGGAGFKGSA